MSRQLDVLMSFGVSSSSTAATLTTMTTTLINFWTTKLFHEYHLLPHSSILWNFYSEDISLLRVNAYKSSIQYIKSFSYICVRCYFSYFCTYFPDLLVLYIFKSIFLMNIPFRFHCIFILTCL